MNKHILFVMRSLDNPELFTQQEKEANKIAAYAADAAAYAADTAVYAAYAAAYADDAAAAAAYADDAAAAAAYADAAYAADAAAAYADADAADAAVEYWVNLFFKRPGKDKQEYINEVERLRE